MDNQVMTALAVATLTNGVVSWLKRSSWAPWIDENTKTINRCLAMLLTFATTAGITCSGSWEAGWSCAIPPAAQLKEFFIRWLAHFAASKGLYELGARRP